VTRDWLTEAASLKALDNPEIDLPDTALLHLILKAAAYTDSNLPETYRMDKSRLVTLFNDWQDVTILGCILIIFKGVAGPKCTPAQLTSAKSDLWTLLNDTETTMKHIILQMSSLAGKIRGTPLTEGESTALDNLVDKTLAPESKLYDLLQRRVMSHIYSTSPEALAKHGLTQLAGEIETLAAKIRKLAAFNKKVYSSLYALLIQDASAQKLSDEELLTALIKSN
jgi:T-complex protein 11